MGLKNCKAIKSSKKSSKKSSDFIYDEFGNKIEVYEGKFISTVLDFEKEKKIEEALKNMTVLHGEIIDL